MSADLNSSPSSSPDGRESFATDFKRFFVRGLAAILPTLITLLLLVWVWDFLWDNIGKHLVYLVCVGWFEVGNRHPAWFQTWHSIRFYYLSEDDFSTRALGVILSIILVYFVGVFVGNLIGRTAWRVVERAVLRIPFVRAIYPAVKQITDFILAERNRQFEGSRVVAVQPHAQGIWSIGLVTSTAEWKMDSEHKQEMVTVFIPSTPTSFTGYVLVVPRDRVVDLPISVEEAMRLLISGGVIMPGEASAALLRPQPEAKPEIPISKFESTAKSEV